jgi:hypothetical protein
MIQMTELLYSIKIEKIDNRLCSDIEVKFLLNIFTTAIESIAPTYTKEAWFDLASFPNSEIYGVDNFRLMIMRKSNNQWSGAFFQYESNKQLHIFAAIEQD